MRWTGELEMFPCRGSLASTQEAGANEAADLEQVAVLAWGLRQQDSERALQLAHEVLAQVPLSDLADEVRDGIQARMRLVQAEVALLGMRLDEAQGLLDQAELDFSALQDLRGLCDLHWLRHYVAADRGQAECLRQGLETAIELAERVGDGERLLLLQLTLARSELFRDQMVANHTWDARLPRSTEGLSPACAAAVADYRGLQCGLSSEFAPAAQWLIEAYRWSVASGQLRRALSVASNLGYTYTSMSDYAQAVEWLQRGLSLARESGWPGSLSLALAQTGDAMRRIGQLSAARELLLECQALLAAHPHNRSAMLALKYLSEIELDLQENESALQHFQLLAERAQSVDSKDMHTDAALGQARALLRLRRLAEAREAALHAREVAQQQRERSTLVDILWTLAEIGQAEGQSPEAVLPWLQQALAQAERLPGYCPPPALLESAAAAHAARGDFSAAYQLSQRASEVRQQVFTEESGKQAAVLHVQHQVERRARRARAFAAVGAGRVGALAGFAELAHGVVASGRERQGDHRATQCRPGAGCVAASCGGIAAEQPAFVFFARRTRRMVGVRARMPGCSHGWRPHRSVRRSARMRPRPAQPHRTDDRRSTYGCTFASG